MEKIGRYTVVKEIGRGPMTTVYFATDPDFGTQLAIKVFDQLPLQDATVRGRLEHEARLVALLDHPHIVNVHAVGEQDGQLYVAMDFMAGGSLATRLAQGPLDLAEVVRILNCLAEVLDTVHTMGIQHRDLKPSNILFDANGEAFLTDFGMQHLAPFDPTATSSLVVGTPAYMSPEQVRGESNVSERSDIYSLGVILFRMLTSRLPFTGGSLVELAVRQTVESPPSLHDLRPDLPPLIQQVVLRALAKDPNQRFASATDMAQAFYNALSGIEDQAPYVPLDSSPATVNIVQSRSTHAPPPGLQYPQTVSKGGSKFGQTILVGLGFILILLAGSAGIDFLFSRKPPLPIPEATTLPSATFPPLTATFTLVPTTLTLEPVATLTPEPTITQAVVEPTSTQPPETPTVPDSNLPARFVLSPPGPVIGGADLLAFINNKNIFVSNLDGTGLTQITGDDKAKSGLRWWPDGNALLYSEGNAVKLLHLDTRQPEDLGSFEVFDISPDLTRAIVGVRVQDPNKNLVLRNFLVQFDNGFDPAILRSLRLSYNSPCSFEKGGRLTRFSPKGDRLVTVVEMTVGAKKKEVIQVWEIGPCGQPWQEVEYGPRGGRQILGYDLKANDNPVINDYSWVGGDIIAFNGAYDKGYGEIVIYNLIRRDWSPLYPISDKPYYRDLRLSPDGTYLMFAYRDFSSGAYTQLFYIPLEGSGAARVPDRLNLQSYFFQKPADSLQPALRPAP